MACWTPQGQHWSTSLLTERELSKDCWNHANCGFSISPCCVNLTSYSTRIIQIPGTRTSHMRTLKQRCGRLNLNYRFLFHTHSHNASLMSAIVREKNILRLTWLLWQVKDLKTWEKEKAQKCLGGRKEKSTNHVSSYKPQPINRHNSHH